ncbi:MAG: DegT/DnrJ/EryC1/StrS family aminotransferase, partial [Tepidimonas sp.]|uniref:DegT/DnrJ/EryC1/StrS family aminotransferase n=1 Tax=Tepidimonas sp. TaxID=2002775 RepID=UPI004054D21F
MEIPLVDLKAQYAPLEAQIAAGMAEALASMRLFLGPNTQALEAEFAAYCEVGHAIGVSDGTAALELALLACDVGPGDEVVTAAHTFIATAEAIALVGARPVFVDIDPATCTIAVGEIEQHIGPRTRAIIPVHLYGQPADMDSIMAVAEKRGLWVIEDACQAHGARYKGRRAGSLGHMAAFSFYYSKNLGAYGEGGMVTTNDQGLAERVRMLRDHGSRQRYHHEMIGRNARLDELQAAVLRVKLPHLDTWNARRRAAAAHYNALLRGLPGIQTPQAAGYAEHVYHLYVLRCAQRDALQQHLRERGVSTGIHYPVPCHLQPAFAHLGYREGDLPETERAAREVLSLPMYPELSTEQRQYVA